MVGAWDFMEGTKVDLYDDVQEAITNGGFSSQTLAGSQIGEARVRAIEYVSGIQGTADARFHLYIYEISMNSGKTISQAKSIYDSATPNRIADIVVAFAIIVVAVVDVVVAIVVVLTIVAAMVNVVVVVAIAVVIVDDAVGTYCIDVCCRHIFGHFRPLQQFSGTLRD